MESRYPGTKVYPSFNGPCMYVNKVPIQCLWIAPESPVQALRDVDRRKRADMVLTGAFIEPIFRVATGRPNPNLPDELLLGFASGMNLSVQQVVSFGESSRPLFKAKVTAINSREAQIQISLPADGVTLSKVPADWSQTQVVRMPYGGSKTLTVSDAATNVPAHKVDLILRLQRLGRE